MYDNLAVRPTDKQKPIKKDILKIPLSFIANIRRKVINHSLEIN